MNYMSEEQKKNINSVLLLIESYLDCEFVESCFLCGQRELFNNKLPDNKTRDYCNSCDRKMNGLSFYKNTRFKKHFKMNLNEKIQKILDKLIEYKLNQYDICFRLNNEKKTGTIFENINLL